MFINLYVKLTQGPQAGEVMSLACLGERNLLYQLDEMAKTSVEVVGVEVAGGDLGDLSESTEDRVRSLLAKRIDNS